jgi:hypothetical protein
MTLVDINDVDSVGGKGKKSAKLSLIALAGAMTFSTMTLGIVALRGIECQCFFTFLLYQFIKYYVQFHYVEYCFAECLSVEFYYI